MPTYDYECDGCQHTFELFQSINDPVKRKCPACGKQKLRRLFGAGAAVVFKGSGFYQTDYRSESYKKRAKAESDSGSGGKDASAKSDGGKSESAKAESGKSESGQKNSSVDSKSSKPKKRSAE
jgi:putative FmdB family regulatory protein